MWKSEDKMKAVLPYALKRKIKITFKVVTRINRGTVCTNLEF